MTSMSRNDHIEPKVIENGVTIPPGLQVGVMTLEEHQDYLLWLKMQRPLTREESIAAGHRPKEVYDYFGPLHDDLGPGPESGEETTMTMQPMVTAPRDGREIILVTRTGIISARYQKGEGNVTTQDGTEYEGPEWVCYDDAVTIDIEETPEGEYCPEALGWLPYPAEVEASNPTPEPDIYTQQEEVADNDGRVFVPSHVDSVIESRARGYTGDNCIICGMFTMINNGTCLVCDNCGQTTGCS